MRRTAFFLLLVLSMGAFLAFVAAAVQPVSQEKDKTVQAPAQPPQAKDKAAPIAAQLDKIVPAPKNIKERTAIYVFVAWLWVGIIILIYIVRLEIRESDRVLNLKFYRENKK